ncbi:MAG: ribbon-helix-helix protein, CopG family [Anaerolineales bacterium]|nr:ribbon-helix-helix protein, CopG family [Anaerolineales bacterium]
MSTQMVRKQIYIPKRQHILLKQLAKAQGISESELIRQAIDREILGEVNQPTKTAHHTAWQEIVSFIRERQQAVGGATQPLLWDREAIYAERENRWVEEKNED